jgi:Tol biopolymer transport system component
MFLRTLFLFVVLTSSGIAADGDAAKEARFLKNTRQLIYEGKRSGEGYFSPDGKRIIFQSEREEGKRSKPPTSSDDNGGNPFYQIYTLDLESGDSRRVSPGMGKTTCAFFQPGTDRVIFASTHEDPEAAAKQKAEIEMRASGKQRRYAWDYDATMDIYSCHQDGTQIVNLTKSPGYDAEGSFSPDGKQIVFCSLRSAFPPEKLTPEQRARFEKDPAYWGDIYLMNADGSDVRRLTEAPGYDGGPFFSPDGKRIVWRHFDESGMVADVWTMATDGSDKRRITDFKSMSWAPYYHPSGQYFIFTTNKLGFENFELYLVDAAGAHEPVRVTYTPGFDGLPVFSPDGKKLAWASGRTGDGKSQIFLADWNDAEALKALEEAPLRVASVEERVKALEAYISKADPQIKPGNGAGTGDSATRTGGFALRYPAGMAGLQAISDYAFKPEITVEDLKFEVGHLASEQLAGRATGSPGAQLASEWLGIYLQTFGLKSLPGRESLFQAFEFNAGERIIEEKSKLEVIGATPAAQALDKDFRPLAFSDNGEAEGEVVFAGYGLSVPEGTGQQRYNSYEGLDVKDKIVLILRYVPEDVEPARRAHLNRYSGLRYKAMMARERGAKAVLIVTGPGSPNAGELLPLTGDGSSAGSGIIAASISGNAAAALLAPGGKNLKDLQKALDNENPHAEGGFVLPKVKVKIAAGVEHIRKTDRNVIGCIPGETDEWIIVGAHYDHLGLGKGNSSLARAGEEGKIHPGADDNASGTAAVIEIAAALAQAGGKTPALPPGAQKGDPGVSNSGTLAVETAKWKPTRGIIFALWSGEEIGLIGSNSFVEKPPVPLAKVVAYINFDMVGRLHDNKLTMQAVGSSKAWPRLLEKRNVAAGFQLGLQEDPYLPTDVTSFYPKRIPVLNFFTGSHDDYHRPSDTADKLDYDGLARIAKFARAIIEDVATAPERPDFSRVERKEQGGGRDTMRAYLGSIPDYATEVKGVKLSGVRGGSPAEKGGLKGGDVIVEFGAQKIANIYDYTYALDAVKIGQPVKMTVERDGKRVELSVTPEARK